MRISPGSERTPRAMAPIGRFGAPGDVAVALNATLTTPRSRTLCSPLSSHLDMALSRGKNWVIKHGCRGLPITVGEAEVVLWSDPLVGKAGTHTVGYQM